MGVSQGKRPQMQMQDVVSVVSAVWYLGVVGKTTIALSFAQRGHPFVGIAQRTSTKFVEFVVDNCKISEIDIVTLLLTKSNVIDM